MGLFGPKKPVEEKNFSKALSKAANLNDKSNAALMEATAAYPAGWQGYWFIALFYDFGAGKDAQMDPAKAQEYFMKAEAAAKGTPGEAWLNNFLTWYRRPAGNLVKPIKEKYEKIRRLGVALMNCYQYQTPVITAPCGKKDDATTFALLLVTASGFDVEVSDYEYDAFKDLFDAYADLFLCKDREDLLKAVNPIIKKYNKANDVYKDCMKALEKGKKPAWHKLHDMYAYMLGYCCINDGPFITGDIASEWGHPSEAALGIYFYLFAAHNGNQTAIHELIRLSKASEANYKLMESVFRRRVSTSDDLELYLMRKLLKCLEKGDDEAFRLAELYYADELAKLSQ